MRKDSLKAGDTFGRLTVIRFHHSSKRRDGSAGERIMLCLCTCGKEVEVRTSNLKSGTTKSCGCLHSENTRKSNLVRSESVSNIEDDIAFCCECGCVSFNILKSKAAECISCQSKYKLSSIFK